MNDRQHTNLWNRVKYEKHYEGIDRIGPTEIKVNYRSTAGVWDRINEGAIFPDLGNLKLLEKIRGPTNMK